MASVGPSNQVPCHFPFMYKDEQHTGCVTGTKGEWCPVNVELNRDDDIINVDYLDSETPNNKNIGDWGYCGTNCPLSSSDKNKISY